MTNENIETRLMRLERTLRIWQLATLALLAGVVSMWAVSCGQETTEEPAQEQGPADIVRAKRIEVVNESGAVVVAIAALPQGGALSTFDGQDHELVRLGAAEGGVPGIELYRNGNVLARMGSTPAGQGALSVFGPGPVELAAISPVQPGGCGGLTVRDPSGERATILGGCGLLGTQAAPQPAPSTPTAPPSAPTPPTEATESARMPDNPYPVRPR